MSDPVRIVRVFLAHPKHIEDEALDAFELRVKLLTTTPTQAPNITRARQSFLEYEMQHGKPVNWQRWQEHVTGTLTTYGTEARFPNFVAGPGPYVGKATAELLELALKRGRKVFRMTPDGQLARATKVVLVDDNNWLTGWILAGG